MIPDGFDALTLRLLRLFETIYRTRNVSHAADILGVSQPSVSLSLNRLRQHFDDPLFVRVGAKMEPTPRADKLVEAVRHILLIAQDEFVTEASFNPATSTRAFTLHMTDLGETIIVPKLLNYLIGHAPGVRLRVREVGESSQILLGEGSVDLILGFLARESEDLVQRKLFDEMMVGIARADHPRIKGRVTPEQWRSESHVTVSIAGTGHTGIDPGTELQRDGAPAGLELPGFLAIGAAIAETDMVAAVPSRLADQLRGQIAIQQFALPYENPPFQVRQYWHSRFHHDPGNRWMRNLVAELFSSGRAETS
jgi:DNA-binding transcriptional LysR family regulator